MKTFLLLVLSIVTLFAASAADKDEKAGENAAKEKISEKISTILDEADRKRDAAVDAANLGYRTAFAKTFEFADSVEVFLLDFSMGEDGTYKVTEEEDKFEIYPYDKKAKILKRRKVADKDIRKWCDAVTKTLSSDKEPIGMALCHYPIHGIRIYSHNALLFGTSYCWHCANFYFCYGPNGNRSGWISLTQDSKELRELFDGFMPIPEAEMKRFKNPKKKAE